jgi:tripartite-type tricarboxylate transporter receptor subunit TctC
MNTSHISRIAVPLLAAAALALPTIVSAQGYPAKPVRVIVPFPAGGGTDLQARVIFREVQDQFAQTVIVDNRPGASGLIGADSVVNAPADGYTLLFTTAALAINATLNANIMKFDPVTALAPITWVSSTPLVLTVHPNVPAKSAKELIELAAKRPAVLNAAINVPGSTSHLSAEMFKQFAGLRFTTVPYKGGNFSMMALVTGEIDFQFAEGNLAAPQIRVGKARALAVTTAKPSPHFPNLPTMDSIMPGFVADQWFAMYFRGGTAKEHIATMNAAIRKALGAKAVRALFEQDALMAVGTTPDELGVHLKREIGRYAEVIRKGNITVQ